MPIAVIRFGASQTTESSQNRTIITDCWDNQDLLLQDNKSYVQPFTHSPDKTKFSPNIKVTSLDTKMLDNPT